MRRLDTRTVGDDGEAEAARLLTRRGWAVENLNDTVANHPLYDLRASKNGCTINISVKTARSANRHVRFGPYAVISQLADDAFIFVFLSPHKGTEIDIGTEAYELWIVPGHARHIAIDAHVHYHSGDELAAASSTSPVMVKDKIDRSGGRSISGAAFNTLRNQYKDAWTVLPA